MESPMSRLFYFFALLYLLFAISEAAKCNPNGSCPNGQLCIGSRSNRECYVKTKLICNNFDRCSEIGKCVSDGQFSYCYVATF